MLKEQPFDLKNQIDKKQVDFEVDKAATGIADVRGGFFLTDIYFDNKK